MPKVDRLFSLLLTIFDLLLDALRFIRHSLQPRCTLAAENLFLRKQLALYLERQVKPHAAVVFSGDRFVSGEMVPLELYSIQELNYVVGDFFDRALYYLLRGYELQAKAQKRAVGAESVSQWR